MPVTYESFVQGPIGPIIAFSETVNGVTFAIERTAGQFRSLGPWGDGNFNNPPFEMAIGGGGGSVVGFTLVTSHDVSLDSFDGLSQQFNTAPIFDVTGSGVSSLGNAFSTSGFPNSDPPVTEMFVGGPLALVAGETYTFNVTNPGAAVVGHFTAFEFTPTFVPLPAAWPIMLVAFGGLVRCRKTR